MNTKTSLQLTIIGLISIFLFSLSWASGHGRTIELDPNKSHMDAKATAVINNSQVSIQAAGLKPNAVYTVWFVNTKPKKHETGAGMAPYMFRTDKWGGGEYSSTLSESPFGKWAMLMIVQHPNGNPKDMKSMVGALKARL